MEIKHIHGNVDVPFVLIQRQDLPKWRGFYLETDQQQTDLIINGQKYMMFSGDSFEQPRTDWGLMNKVQQQAKITPLKFPIRDFEVVSIEPRSFMPWEGFGCSIVETENKTFVTLYNTSNLILDQIKLLQLDEINDLWTNRIDWKVSDTTLRLQPATEHGAMPDLKTYYDIIVNPGVKQIDFYKKVDADGQIAVYRIKK